MGAFAAGEVVLVTFPFSDLSASKVRPAVALAAVGRGDWVLCQITSQPYADPAALALAPSDFAGGTLNTPSYARPGKLFTAHESLFLRSAAMLRAEALDRVIEAVISVLRPS